MSEICATITNDPASQVDFNLEARLDALECGECTGDDFLRDVLLLQRSSPSVAWTILALIDQRYRRGDLPESLFRSIKSKISRSALEDRDYGTTIELQPALRTSSGAIELTGQLDTAGYACATRADKADQIESDQSQTVVVGVLPATTSPMSLEQTVARSNPQALEVGRVLRDRYVLEGVLGRGGMGTVFKALDRNRADLPVGNRHVAVKILHHSISRRPEILADLRREFYCAQALSHQNIVKVHEIYHDDDVAFFTMELIEGELLSGVLRRIHPRPLVRRHAWEIIRAVGAGLVHAHSRNVVHGDLKPQNVMTTERGEVRILDFGASSTLTRQWSASDPLQRNKFLAVTPAYTCCELLDGQQTDPRDDLYALACLSYELLAGDHPFQGRCSTEARDLEMRPRRPRGLTHRQWRTLKLGLSWYRENRSISVRAWLAKLGLERMAEPLPPPHALDAMDPRDWTPSAVRHTGLLVALIAVSGLWVAFGHTAFDVNHVREPLPSEATLNSPSNAQPGQGGQLSVPGANIFTQPMPTDVLHSSPELQPAPVSSQSESLSVGVTRVAAPVELRAIGPRKITLSTDTYRVRSGERFAEIYVRRSGESSPDGSFVWWTEPSSAKAPDDFVPQSRTTQRFSNGRHVVSIFIRIVPDPLRTHAKKFYVLIADPSGDYSLGGVARAEILIPPGG
jgi:serine/threonine protein kinase